MAVEITGAPEIGTDDSTRLEEAFAAYLEQTERLIEEQDGFWRSARQGSSTEQDEEASNVEPSA